MRCALATALALIFGALTGCSPGPPIVVGEGPVAHNRHMTRLPAACTLWQRSVVDSRDTEAVGAVVGRAVLAPELGARIRKALSRGGLRETSGDLDRAVEIEILSAYGKSASGSVSFNTVLRAKIGDTSIVARGNDTGMNWFSTEREVAGGLFRSADLASAALLGKLAPHC